MKKLFSFFVIFLAIVSANLFAQKIEQPKSQFFIENKGQWDNQVQYLARLGGLNLWVTKSGVVYDYYKIERDERQILESGEHNPRAGEVKKMWGHIISSKFIGTNEHCTPQVFDQRESYYNYFIGNDTSKWASFVPLYGSVQLSNIYNNIDIRYYYDNSLVRYDWIVRPGADPSKIRIKFEGQDGMRVNEKGDLVLQTSLGEVEHAKILAYQMQNGIQNIVECKFKDEGNGIVSFELGKYNKNQNLVIDPLLVHSTFLGGTFEDKAMSCKIDNLGYAYITGYTVSSDFPTTNGAYDRSYNSREDIFITKMNQTGSNLIYSTFLGGSDHDFGMGIAVDGSGGAYITGYTFSTDFPITEYAFDKNLTGGNAEAFVTKLNSTGSSLIYSTYLGGKGGDVGTGIAVDGYGCAYVVGRTYYWAGTNDFPITIDAWDRICNEQEVFITKFNITGSYIDYSTYLGGSSHDCGYGIAVDGAGCAYITGFTVSSDFPVIVGSWDNSKNTEADAFVTKLNSNGSWLIYSTYLGGDNTEYGNSIAVDASGCAYICGETRSTNFPTTSGCLNPSLGGALDAFVMKLNNTGTSLVYSTYLGGAGGEKGYGVVIDDVGNAIIAGRTYSSNFPVTPDAYHRFYNGEGDVFFTIINKDGKKLNYSTFLGGSRPDSNYNNCVAYNKNSAIIVGYTISSDFPTTPGAWDRTYNQGEGFVARFNLTSVNVKEEPIIKDNSIALSLIDPNPSSDGIRFSYSISSPQNITIAIYNMLGERVVTISEGYKAEGTHNREINVSQLPSGAYLLQITGNTSYVNRMINIMR
ncbi:MAG TPA: SBBP repeat-containing protein [Candidatus Kapabacteria bacterium]|nr:SBBP repeat-containing protein [Candidatus Kapabacteria bacterium]HOV92063.1 SBBP repeat-containing protein [Candidatus Kapabacteria bacterium]